LEDPVIQLADSASVDAAVLGAVLAAAGYLGKLLVEAWVAWRQRRATRRASLLELQALLRAANAAFEIQNDHAKRMSASLQKNHPSDVRDRAGYERYSTQLFDRMTADERDLHSIIRGITEYALLPINEKLLGWLSRDLTYRVAPRRGQKRVKLAAKLNHLESHLLLWQATYHSWIPNQERHALVYMADEEHHGVGFPRGLDALVDEVVAEMNGSATIVTRDAAPALPPAS